MSEAFVTVSGVKAFEKFTVEEARLLRQMIEVATNVAAQLGIERLRKASDPLIPAHLTEAGARWVQRRRNRIVDATGRAAWRWRYVESARRYHRRRKARVSSDAAAIWGRFGVRGKPAAYETGETSRFYVRRHWRTLPNGQMVQVPGANETLAPLTDRARRRRSSSRTRPYMRRVNRSGPIWPALARTHTDVFSRLLGEARDIAIREGRLPRRSELRRAVADLIGAPAGGAE